MKSIVSTMAAAAFLMCAVSVVAAEPQSGLQEGEKAGYYVVTDCTGPNAGKTLCYR